MLLEDHQTTKSYFEAQKFTLHVADIALQVAPTRISVAEGFGCTPFYWQKHHFTVQCISRRKAPAGYRAYE